MMLLQLPTSSLESFSLRDPGLVGDWLGRMTGVMILGYIFKLFKCLEEF